jgi:hypothetical protein
MAKVRTSTPEGIYVKFSLEGDIIYQCSNPEEMRDVMGFAGVGNILRAVKIKESTYKFFENERQLEEYLQTGQQYRIAIEHTYTGNVYVSAGAMAKETGMKATTLDRWAKEGSHGLQRVQKHPIIYNSSLHGRYPGRREAYFDWQECPSDKCSSAMVNQRSEQVVKTENFFLRDASRTDYRPSLALLHTEDEFTPTRAGQKCLLLSDKICGEHNCKIQFLDGCISYCRRSQIIPLSF